MSYQSIHQCVEDLEKTGQLLVFGEPISANLEVSQVQRRMHRAGGPAILFRNVKDCKFPMVANLYATEERARFLLRFGYQAVENAIKLKADPLAFLQSPISFLKSAFQIPNVLPRWVAPGRSPVLQNRVQVSQLPQHICWPNDGGPFVTLPAVYSHLPDRMAGLFSWIHSNLGMYRVQLGGNDYRQDQEIGLHYQLHRGIGVHHSQAVDKNLPFYVNIFVGGNPALPFSAVMPLPEGLPELALMGLLGGRAPRLTRCPESPLPILAEVDFCIVGKVDPRRLALEGPFGDHLGYYSLKHLFPVLEVLAVYHRSDAIWPFTTVGRPPQEDTIFGKLIHELTAPALSTVLKGVKAVHAVDEAGVHPLLLAIASERYTPYAPRIKPQEILTIANAILGQGQLSLAKYLLIAASEDDPGLDIHNVAGFFQHILARLDFSRDLHFHTESTIDTLDYSGTGLHTGSKLVMAAVGQPIRSLPSQSCPSPSDRLVSSLAVCFPGVLALSLGDFPGYQKNGEVQDIAELLEHLDGEHPSRQFPLWVITDQAGWTASDISNFLWETFTRSNPASDVYGYRSRVFQKHWSCQAPLVIDARTKPHHAPPLIEDPEIEAKVDQWCAPGGPLHGYRA